MNHFRTYAPLVTLSVILLVLSIPLRAFQPPRMHPTDRFILTLFTDVWQDVPGEMDLGTIQRGVSVEALQDMPLGRSNFAVAAGLAFTGHNLYGDHRYAFDPGTEQFDFQEIQVDYDKNKLSLNYVDVPVQFRFRSRDLNRTFRIYGGIKAGYLINAHTKYTGKAPEGHGDRTIKVKEHKLDNIVSYRIGLTAMVGYGSLNFHLYYPLTDVFEDNSAGSMVPVSLGVSLILF